MDLMNSEGIAFKKPKGKSSKLNSAGSRKRGASSVQDSVDIDLDILRTYEQPSETITRRAELYNKNLQDLENSLKDVQRKFNDDLDRQLQRFVGNGFKLVDTGDNVVPVGILESCLSVGENTAIFDSVEATLLELPTSVADKVFVSRIKSGTSSTTKAVLQNIYAQLIGNGEACVTDDDEIVEASPEKTDKDSGKRPKRQHYAVFDVKSFMSTLKGSYQIVIVLEDVDYYANSVITEILTVLGSTGLPVTFILGVTHGHFLQNLIPLSSSSEFVLETFYSVSPYERFDEFMRRILFKTDASFRLSGKIISYLESQYREENYSVDQIRNSMKFCLRYHFLTAKSAFCSLDDPTVYQEESIDIDQYYQKWEPNSTQTPRKRSKSSSPTDALKDSLVAVKDWQFLLRWLCLVNNSLPESPLGKTWASTFVTCYEGFSYDKDKNAEEPFHRFFQALEHLSKEEFKRLLEDSLEYLKVPRNSCGSDLVDDVIVEFQNRLAELEKGDLDETSHENKTAAVLKKKKMSREELKKVLLESQREKEGTQTLHKTKSELLETLKKLLKVKFPCFSSVKNADVFVFGELNQLINALYPANFLQLNEDITCPTYVLQCDCCSDLDPSAIDSSLPDVCIVQKLLLEHTTRKVDLNLIYHAFLSVVQPQTTGRKSKSANAKDADAIASYLIRFRRSVGELQHMGFVKRSKSKPDEVTRLTWW